MQIDKCKPLITMINTLITFLCYLRLHVIKHSQRFVIDHMAKPYIKEGKITGWKEDMARIAQFPNVYCKM